MSKTKIILFVFLFLLLPSFAGASYYPGQSLRFFVDSSYDDFGRKELEATLQHLGKNAYFFIERDWWDALSPARRNLIREAILSLDLEFANNIYPKLRSIFGEEPKPGIDGDERIFILFHQMKKEAGGYFNSGDNYPRLQNPRSNEKEIIYINTQVLGTEIGKSAISHEFLHLITFNQKDLLRKVSEEIWLNEIRADYTPTLLGYDEVYSGSNLEQRIRAFLSATNDSLTEWKNISADYGVVNLFGQYLVDHYGIKVLVDSLHSSNIGIPSINQALQKNGFREDFSQVFTDWTIAILVNDCNFGPKYCYKNPNLKNIKITPQLNFLPLTGESMLSVVIGTTYWAGNWQKIIGGKGILTLEFEGDKRVGFKVPYLLCDKRESCQIDFLVLNSDQKGKLTLLDFNTKYSSLTFIPSIQSKISGFDGREPSFTFSFTVSISQKTEKEREAELIKQLLAQIEFLQKEIARVQAQINEILGKKPATPLTEIPAGFKFEKNLSAGITDADVVYLKIILATEGCVSGLSNTDWFGPKTLEGVKCFQKKYKDEISAAAGYPISASGFVGTGTRTKLNQLIK